MNNTEMIRELRSLTQAGMKDCKDALVESGWDLQKAVDIVKVKGLNVVDGRSSKVAAEGLVDIVVDTNLAVMIEVNCQTDFVANSKEFAKFVHHTKHKLYENVTANLPFQISDVESERIAAVSSIKENVVVRRWWAEQVFDSSAKIFTYQHSNNKIGVLLTLKASSESIANSPEFKTFGEELAMQIAAMNPVAVSSDRIDSEVLDRQKNIFDTQIKEMNKPAVAAAKIIEGKFRKWYTEVCLLEQESVIVPKTTVNQLLKSLGEKLGGEVNVVNFTRCQVGEGIEVQKENYADEVARLSGVPNTVQVELGSQDVFKD